MPLTIGRREFIATLSGAAAWPLAARAQQPGRKRLQGLVNAMRMGSNQVRYADDCRFRKVALSFRGHDHKFQDARAGQGIWAQQCKELRSHRHRLRARQS